VNHTAGIASTARYDNFHFSPLIEAVSSQFLWRRAGSGRAKNIEKVPPFHMIFFDFPGGRQPIVLRTGNWYWMCNNFVFTFYHTVIN
jgi:hypothetical protein